MSLTPTSASSSIGSHETSNGTSAVRRLTADNLQEFSNHESFCLFKTVRTEQRDDGRSHYDFDHEMLASASTTHTPAENTIPILPFSHVVPRIAEERASLKEGLKEWRALPQTLADTCAASSNCPTSRLNIWTVNRKLWTAIHDKSIVVPPPQRSINDQVDRGHDEVLPLFSLKDLSEGSHRDCCSSGRRSNSSSDQSTTEPASLGSDCETGSSR